VRHLIFAIAVAFALALACGQSVLASTYGAVSGTVTDDAGRPVANAAVSLSSPDSATQRTASGADGRYAFPRVNFDTYTVSVTAPGFADQSVTVTVSSGSVATVNFQLTVRSLGKIVTRASVSSHPVSVDVISTRTIQTLPGNNTLAKVTETVPGIVPFSYGEPVSRGYHGITYEVDGVPIPQTASSEFAEIIDPRDIDRLEVFTGAFPAEFGGSREGAVVDILTRRVSAAHGGSLSLSGGSYGYGAANLSDSFGNDRFKVFTSFNIVRNARGIDSPTLVPVHDDSSQGDEFLRAAWAPNQRDTWAFDFSNQYAAFQIPIDTDPSHPNFSVPGTDDNQHEYDRFANITFNHLTADGKGYLEIAPWYRQGRVTYLPDPANDLAGGSASTTFQDRRAQTYGVTSAYFRGGSRHNVKVGFTAAREDFTSQFQIQFIDPMLGLQTFSDNVSQPGFNFGSYIQDKITISPVVTLNAGVRYDHSTGFTSGNQISPRIEADIQADDKNTVHFYYGRLYAAPGLEDVRRDAAVVGGTGGVPVYDLKPERDSVYEEGIAHSFSPLTHGYLTLWWRNVTNVLDTTQLGSTPIFTIFNSAIGRAQGAELNVEGQNMRGNSYFFSYGMSQSLAEGISGGTFLFSPAALQGANSFALEDHDQTYTLNTAYTWALGGDRNRYLTLGTRYGSGFPVQFENGPGRLPVHWEVDASVGSKVAPGHLGWEVQATNLLNHQYLIKFNNGFNTTQYAAGRQVTLKLSAPLP
jgi:outer membrane receptor protein involved in Fe transport